MTCNTTLSNGKVYENYDFKIDLYSKNKLNHTYPNSQILKIAYTEE